MLGRTKSFYEGVVMDALKDMDQGLLRVHLPDGRATVIGRPGTGIDASIRVIRDDFFRKCVLFGDVGFGEAYVDGDWETDDLTGVIRWMIANVERHPTMSGSKRQSKAVNWLAQANRWLHRWRSNTRSGSRKNIRAHYDLSNEFFRLFLDETMTYSAAYFRSPQDSLEDAQRAKYDALCRKLRLKPGEHVLEIGCGWGGFAEYAAKTYDVRVTGITISEKQFDYARERIHRAGLADRVEIRFQDYRSLEGRFDKIVSIEMLEAVGHEFLEPYFAKVQEVLKPHGAVGLQVITCPDSRYASLRRGVDWIQKHIFPGSLLPSVGAMQSAIGRTGDLMLHHLENLAPHYADTLSRWRQRFNARRHDVLSLGFSESFLRQWNYYFSYCEAAFAMRNISVLQMVYTRPNNPDF